MTPAQRYAEGLRQWRGQRNYAQREFLRSIRGDRTTPYRFGARSEAVRARLNRRGGSSRRA